jgi:hypothetical protein
MVWFGVSVKGEKVGMDEFVGAHLCAPWADT